MGPRNVMGWGTCGSHVGGQLLWGLGDKQECQFEEGQSSFWLDARLLSASSVISVYIELLNQHFFLVHSYHCCESRTWVTRGRNAGPGAYRGVEWGSGPTCFSHSLEPLESWRPHL